MALVIANNKEKRRSSRKLKERIGQTVAQDGLPLLKRKRFPGKEEEMFEMLWQPNCEWPAQVLLKFYNNMYSDTKNI